MTDEGCLTSGRETTFKDETQPRMKGKVTERKEMDILRDLPSFNRSNFSRYISNGGTLNKSKSYVWLKSQSKSDFKPQVIVMDSQSQIITELEAMMTQQQVRIALKRTSSSRSECGGGSQTESSSASSCKLARTEQSDEDSIDSWDM